MKITVYILICLLFVTFNSSAQEDSVQVVNEKVNTSQTYESKPKIKPYYGLIFGLSFGSYTRIQINPMVGFPISPKFSLGGKVSYEYVKDTRNSLYDLTWNNYGASAFARYKVVPRAYVHLEYAYINYNSKLGDIKESTWVPFLYAGGGYIQPLGNNVAMSIEVLFDVLQNENSPYKNWDPVISIGVQAGF